MKKRLISGIIIFFVFIAIFFTYKSVRHTIRTNPERARALNAAMPVETTIVKSIIMEEVIGATGEVQQIATVGLTARVGSTILDILVDLGSIVKKGDVLIRWDSRLFEVVLKSAKERVENAKIQLHHARQQLGRLKALQEEGMGSILEVEEAEIEFSDAKLQQAGAQEELVRARLKYENTTLLSPVGGVILGRLVNTGENTMVDQPLLTIAQLDHILMVSYVGEEKIGSIYLGQKAEVTYDAYPGELYTGVVVKIDPKTDTQTRSFKTFIKIPNPDLRLKPGLSGFSKLYRQKTALVVPSISLINPVGDRSTTFVVDAEGRSRLREVKVGILAKGMTEILYGLKEGETIVTTGHLYLRENDLVNPEAFSNEP